MVKRASRMKIRDSRISLKARKARKARDSRKQKRQQRGGSTTMPLQYFNSVERGNYYAEGSDLLTKQYQSAYGAINAVNTTQPNSCMSQMGPNLAPFNPYSGYSGMQTGGAKGKKKSPRK